MKRSSISFLALLLLILSHSGCKSDPVEGELKLLCYNVAGLPEGLSSSQPELLTPLISPLLNEFNIVHVQEDFCYHDDLLSQNEHTYKTETSGCVPFGDGLNTFSDYPILDFYREPWSDCSGADCLTPKGFSYSRIDLGNDVFIDFYNIHCQAGSTDAAYAARRNNVYQIRDYILSNSEGEAIIIMGDFNNRYTREQDTIRTFLDMGFSDLWIELIRQGDIPTYGNSLKDCDGTGTNPSCEGVDKFLYKSSDRIKLSPISFQYGDDDRYLYFDGNENIPLSDHKPLFAKMRYELR